MSGFIKLNRTEKTQELMRNIDAFALATIIAYRAKRTSDFNIHGLQAGEAFVGDFKNYGLTEQKYRTAKKKLQKWKIATFKATNKGTIASLLNTDIYDANIEDANGQTNRQATDKQRTANEPATTIKKLRSKEVKKESGDFVPPALSEVSEYIKLKNYSITPETFFKSYEAKGWMVGKTKMVSWQAEIDTWVSREKDSKDTPEKTQRPKVCFYDRQPATKEILTGRGKQFICDSCFRLLEAAPQFKTSKGQEIPKNRLELQNLEDMILKEKAKSGLRIAREPVESMAI